jgi:hypothetical protein
MIRVFVGKLGGGKSACFVREAILNPTFRNTYSNIITTKISNNKLINREMFIKKELIDYKKHRTGASEPIYKYRFNREFWQETLEKEGSINIAIDEAHQIMNARSFASKQNKILVEDFLSMLRRILGSNDAGEGVLTLITQDPRMIEVIGRTLCTHVRYHRCHYQKTCRKCGCTWNETNEHPEQLWSCPRCNSPYIYKHSFRIECWHFADMDAFDFWKNYKMDTYHRHYFINDIEKYFPFYKTLQWDNLFSES